MKAKELMIGDWVECVDPTHKEKVYAQIDAIEEGQTCILVRLDNCNWFLDISFIKPIPLIQKILEKNGFNKIIPKKKFTKSLGYTSKFLKRCLVIELAQNRYKVSLKHEGMSDKITIRHIQYVHELQHILLALGMDADLKIPEKSDGKEAKP